MSDEKREAPGAEPTEPAAAPERPSEAFKAGLGLLWKAAKSAAAEIKHEVERGGVSEALQQAGRELETAAQHVGKTLDDLVHRAGGAVKTDYADKWPPDDATKAAADARPDMVGGAPDDGGSDENGERRDMRIQVDDD